MKKEPKTREEWLATLDEGTQHAAKIMLSVFDAASRGEVVAPEVVRAVAMFALDCIHEDQDQDKLLKRAEVVLRNHGGSRGTLVAHAIRNSPPLKRPWEHT